MTKYIITLLFAFLSAMVLQSCGDPLHSESKYVVRYQSQYHKFSSTIFCDSAAFKNPHFVVAYDKGIKIEIVSPHPISIKSNNNYKP